MMEGWGIEWTSETSETATTTKSNQFQASPTNSQTRVAKRLTTSSAIGIVVRNMTCMKHIQVTESTYAHVCKCTGGRSNTSCHTFTHKTGCEDASKAQINRFENLIRIFILVADLRLAHVQDEIALHTRQNG